MLKNLLDFLVESRCEICSQPGNAICRTCIDATAASHNSTIDFRKPLIVHGHNPDVVRLVISWKDRQRRELTEVFADSISTVISTIDLEGYRIVPIPSRQKSFRKRGWFPTDELARKISQKTGLAYSKNELRYRSEPVEQRGLNHHERERNQSARFEFVGEYSKVLLLDDVFTSGATLSSASQAIKKVTGGFAHNGDANSPKIVAIVAARADFVRFYSKFC